MMDLNLLPSSAKFQADKIRLKSKITLFMWIFGGVWFVIVIGVFGFWIVTRIVLDKNKSGYQAVFNQYKSLAGNVILSQRIKYQAKMVGKVLGERFEYSTSFRKISGDLFNNDNIIIDSFEIDNNKSKIFNINGSVLRGIDLDEVEKKVDDINNGEVAGFAAAKLNSVEVTKDNIWKFYMEVKLE